jgi:hypothetical protein
MSEDVWSFIHPVSDSRLISEIREKANAVVNFVNEDDVKIFAKPNWFVVPVESGDHFCGDDQENLLTTLLQLEYSEIVAVPLENIIGFPPAFIIPVTHEAIEEFNRKCGFFWFAIFSGNPDWMILATKLDYMVVAGESEFIYGFFGFKPSECFSKFSEFATQCTYESEYWQSRLFFVLEQLREFSISTSNVEINLSPPPA